MTILAGGLGVMAQYNAGYLRVSVLCLGELWTACLILTVCGNYE